MNIFMLLNLKNSNKIRKFNIKEYLIITKIIIKIL